MSLLETIATVVLCMGGSFMAGYMWNHSDTEYYRTLVYAYEQQKTREMFK